VYLIAFSLLIWLALAALLSESVAIGRTANHMEGDQREHGLKIRKTTASKQVGGILD